MTERVTVTGPGRPAPPRPGPAPGDVRSVMRAQRRIALTTCAIVTVAVVGLPLLFVWAPGLSRIRLLGFRLPWLILSALAPPVWVAIAGRHVRRAERAERRVTEGQAERAASGRSRSAGEAESGGPEGRGAERVEWAASGRPLSAGEAESGGAEGRVAESGGAAFGRG